ncbi:hypothetical protein [Comamonas sp. lk]|uniref:hypothetical protein n=1 Tax=Comamonas sp. lk TaxID=2201272 RepID=UPI0013CF1BF4|nr:hypothetical protein [Comamonas sp. lk]
MSKSDDNKIILDRIDKELIAMFDSLGGLANERNNKIINSFFDCHLASVKEATAIFDYLKSTRNLVSHNIDARMNSGHTSDTEQILVQDLIDNIQSSFSNYDDLRIESKKAFLQLGLDLVIYLKGQKSE